MLAERNEILAANILAECRRAAAITAASNVKLSGSKLNSPQQFWATLTGSRLATIPTTISTTSSSSPPQQVVVAVLGAAHVNGIRLLLEEGKVKSDA